MRILKFRKISSRRVRRKGQIKKKEKKERKLKGRIEIHGRKKEKKKKMWTLYSVRNAYIFLRYNSANNGFGIIRLITVSISTDVISVLESVTHIKH